MEWDFLFQDEDIKNLIKLKLIEQIQSDEFKQAIRSEIEESFKTCCKDVIEKAFEDDYVYSDIVDVCRNGMKELFNRFNDFTEECMVEDQQI